MSERKKEQTRRKHTSENGRKQTKEKTSQLCPANPGWGKSGSDVRKSRQKYEIKLEKVKGRRKKKKIPIRLLCYNTKSMHRPS